MMSMAFLLEKGARHLLSEQARGGLASRMEGWPGGLYFHGKGMAHDRDGMGRGVLCCGVLCCATCYVLRSGLTGSLTPLFRI